MQIANIKLGSVNLANASPQIANQASANLARKVLDVQKQQAATLLKQLDGVGQNLDMRV